MNEQGMAFDVDVIDQTYSKCRVIGFFDDIALVSSGVRGGL